MWDKRVQSMDGLKRQRTNMVSAKCIWKGFKKSQRSWWTWTRSCVLYPLLDGEISLPSSSYHKRDLPNVSILIIFITFFPLAAPKTFHHVQSVAYITMQMIQQQLEIALVPNTSVGVYHMTEESGHIYTTMLSVAIRSSGCAAQCKKAQCLFFHVFFYQCFY